MNENTKLSYFRYILFRLKEWMMERCGNTKELTKLRLQKLLFLICAIHATEKNHQLLSIFNKFYALPYGPVEMDIYEAMNKNTIDGVFFEGKDCIKCDISIKQFETLDQNIIKLIDESIEALRNKDENYILKNAFDLVEITHKWAAWEIAMSLAKMFNSKSEPMTTEDIYESSMKAY